MTEKNEGFDILTKTGGIISVESAIELFRTKLDLPHFSRIQHIKNSDVVLKIANAMAMCEPDSVFINTGSEEDKRFIRELALKKGEEKPLPMENHTIHYDLKDEQGRIIDRTFYIADEGEDISSLANKMLRDKAYNEIREIMTGIMRGKTMLVGFYSRGPIGARASNPALEITSSAYVMHSAEIL